jgi:hypothetical protein
MAIVRGDTQPCRRRQPTSRRRRRRRPSARAPARPPPPRGPTSTPRRSGGTIRCEINLKSQTLKTETSSFSSLYFVRRKRRRRRRFQGFKSSVITKPGGVFQAIGVNTWRDSTAVQGRPHHGVALQVAFERQTLKPVFPLDRL